MTVHCTACHKKSEKVKKVKEAKCPKCGTFNSMYMIVVPKVRKTK